MDRPTSDAGTADLELGSDIARALRDTLPSVAEHTVAAVIVEVPAYADAFSGEMGMNISGAVEKALLGFLTLASRPGHSDPGTPLGPALDTAYSLGRGEARSGRSVDALLAAYRVGARVAWRELSATAATAGIPVTTMASFADLVFAYIDELSAASVAGHTDELATSGRVRERYLERLGQHLLAGAPADVLMAGAARADWPVPGTLTAVLLPVAHDRGLTALLPAGTLRPREELPGAPAGSGSTTVFGSVSGTGSGPGSGSGTSSGPGSGTGPGTGSGSADSAESVLLLVPDLAEPERRRLLGTLAGRQAVVGPPRPWMQVRSSYLRAVRAWQLLPPTVDGGNAVDTEEHLTDLVLRADPDALADLRAQALAPLAGLRPVTAERLARTLRSWLLHQGRRDEVAAELVVHAQTVRYRMGQLRELYGDRLQDPATVLALTIALGADPPS
jgi:hypothetical protein